MMSSITLGELAELHKNVKTLSQQPMTINDFWSMETNKIWLNSSLWEKLKINISRMLRGNKPYNIEFKEELDKLRKESK